MSGEVYKVTGINPRLELEAAKLLESAELGARYVPAADLFAAFDSEGGLEGISGSNAFGLECLLQYVAVCAGSRRRGVGSALVGHVLGYYAGACRRIWALAPPEAAGFFERFGFVPATLDRLPPALREAPDLRGIEIAAMRILALDLPRVWPVL